jgi:hypothetical protein
MVTILLIIFFCSLFCWSIYKHNNLAARIRRELLPTINQIQDSAQKAKLYVELMQTINASQPWFFKWFQVSSLIIMLAISLPAIGEYFEYYDHKAQYLIEKEKFKHLTEEKNKIFKQVTELWLNGYAENADLQSPAVKQLFKDIIQTNKNSGIDFRELATAHWLLGEYCQYLNLIKEKEDKIHQSKNIDDQFLLLNYYYFIHRDNAFNDLLKHIALQLDSKPSFVKQRYWEFNTNSKFK